MPTGIDDLSIILRERELTPIKEEEILRQLVQKAEVDYAEIEHDLSIIMIVGEKMKSHIGVTATATRALSDNKINIQMMSQGSSEVSIMFVVNKNQEKEAIRALYKGPSSMWSQVFAYSFLLIRNLFSFPRSSL